MAGSTESPRKIFFMDCINLKCNINSEEVTSIMLESFKNMDIRKLNVWLIISDAARYMVKGVKYLAGDITSVFHV